MESKVYDKYLVRFGDTTKVRVLVGADNFFMNCGRL